MGGGFGNRLAARVLGDGLAPAVVGLDPRLEALPRTLQPDAAPAQRIASFYAELLPRLARHVPAVKPNIAFFERFGSAGFAAYEETCRRARDAGLLVIGDVKRGDIGSTAEAYAAIHLDLADAVTLHPLLGTDSLQPFFARCRDEGRAVFLLVRTSNPGAAEFQQLPVPGGTLSDALARAVEQWNRELPRAAGYGPVGAVVGATWPDELARLRRAMPSAWLLLPGVGAQGARAEDVAAAFDARGLGGLVSSSRAVIQAFAPDDRDWLDRIDRAAAAFAQEVRRVSRAAEQPR